MEPSELNRERWFIDSVLFKKCERGPIDPIWFTAALLTWPSGDLMSACLVNPVEGKYQASLFMLLPIVRKGGTEVPYPPVDVMAIRSILASVNADEKGRALSNAIDRMETALRVYRDLRSVADEYPQECEEELEHLLAELVEDRPISG